MAGFKGGQGCSACLAVHIKHEYAGLRTQSEAHLPYSPRASRVALLWTRARIAGHSSITISARYVHPSEDAVLLAVEKLDRRKIGHSEKSASETASDETLLSA